MNNRNKAFIVITILSVLLIGFFIFYTSYERRYILKNGKDFEAKCIDKYKDHVNGKKYELQTVYVFEVISPSEIKGQRFEKTRSKYRVGLTYKGKYIENKKESLIHKKYEFQLID